MNEDVGGYRAESLRRSLATDPRVLESELDVALVSGRVVVRGVVPTEARRAAITTVLAEQVGIERVENLTEVATFPPPATDERIS